ncbi:MAG: EAL domain-containing protein [Burkholderiales bacterium]|nr:MAG: EAL domain-containing protein [Burkholderiales bacterium]
MHASTPHEGGAGSAAHDPLILAPDEGPPVARPREDRHWRVMVVDDDADVHEATCLALKGLVILGRRLELLHASSAAEAGALLRRAPDVAVLLLDVVMETADAGLMLVRQLRDDPAWRHLRIVLRTGQPGQAPELATMAAYDINDYEAKSELTRIRLQTVLTTNIRAHAQMRALEATRQGLELIVQGSASLQRVRGLARYAQGVVTQICAVLGMEPEGLVCAQAEAGRVDEARIVAAAGAHGPLVGQALAAVSASRLRDRLALCLQEERNLLEGGICLYFRQGDGRAVAALVGSTRPLSATEMQLLRIFCANIAVGFENLALYERLVDLAHNDPLLHILNRQCFTAHLDGLPPDCGDMTLALIDIDDFAGINSAFGASLGDEVLKAVVGRLQHHLGERTLLGRLGADTFGALGHRPDLSPDRIRQALAEPLVVAGERLQVSATAGLVQLDGPRTTAAQRLLDARIALKRAQHIGRGQSQFFSLALGQETRHRQRLLSHLRAATREGQMALRFQPRVDLRSGAVVGAAALLQWPTFSGEVLPPSGDMHLAERSGMILVIGEHVLRSGCDQLARLRTLGHTGFRLSIKVTLAQLRAPGFVPGLTRCLSESGVPGSQLELEVSEAVAMEGAQALRPQLEAVRALGIGVAIDDFGTGYSSLAKLHRLPVDRLKIGRGLLSPGRDAAVAARLARLVIDLGRALGLAVVAEGVDTEAQRRWLADRGCQEGQGDAIAPPMDGGQLETWLGGRYARGGPAAPVTLQA